jgi:hypothetical protein
VFTGDVNGLKPLAFDHENAGIKSAGSDKNTLTS